jgi:putative addiction module killer protein
MDKSWVIKYWITDSGKNEIERWFNKLPKEKARSATKELALLRKCGIDLKLPHSRALGKKLFELRERMYGCRIYYTFHEHQMIILLVAGDKSTQKTDILLARERIEELKTRKDEFL